MSVIVLRAFLSRDLPQVVLLFSEPDVAKWNPGPGVKSRETWCTESKRGKDRAAPQGRFRVPNLDNYRLRRLLIGGAFSDPRLT